MTDTRTIEPKLAKPGAGLPFIEWAVAKYMLLPKLFRADQATAMGNFDKECKKILTICEKYSDEELTEKRLIKRVRGLEDSSRYWSIAMTLEHLVIVDEAMLRAINVLSSGIKELPPIPKTGTADVKPEGKMSAQEAIAAFRAVHQKVLAEASAANLEASPHLLIPHPWFGPLNAKQWVVFPSIHTNLHRQQIKLIAEQLDAKKV